MNLLRSLLLLALAGCATAPRSAAPAAATDEAAVYAAVIDHLVPASRTAIVIDSTAVPRGPVAGDVGQRANPELASSFAEANRAARLLPRTIPSARTVRFTRRGELPFFAPTAPGEDLEARWRQFNQRFPGAGGFYEFSAIGFDATRSTALLYTSHSCGSLCGSGNLVTLRRTGGRWQVADAAMLWVS